MIPYDERPPGQEAIDRVQHARVSKRPEAIFLLTF